MTHQPLTLRSTQVVVTSQSAGRYGPPLRPFRMAVAREAPPPVVLDGGSILVAIYLVLSITDTSCLRG